MRMCMVHVYKQEEIFLACILAWKNSAMMNTM